MALQRGAIAAHVGSRAELLKMRVWNIVKDSVRDLYPGYFALVMATGIVSIATFQLGAASVATWLFQISKLAYALLWLLTLLRLIRHSRHLADDLTNHMRGSGFFTIVAGTCVLGSQFIVISADVSTATWLWFLGIGLWLVLIYTFFASVIVHEPKPGLESGLHGGWLIAVVATQSVSVLGTLVAPHFTTGQEPALFFTLSMCLLGGMLYILIISLIFRRLVFLALTPEALTPLYWINMGACAITTLAGATLMLNASRWTFLQELLPFLEGFTIFFWAAATWWIPLLLVLGVWRHLIKRYPLAYDPQYWSLVFPLGMYTAGTFQLARAMDLTFLYVIPGYSVYLALLVWLVTFAGLFHRLGRSLIAASPQQEQKANELLG